MKDNKKEAEKLENKKRKKKTKIDTDIVKEKKLPKKGRFDPVYDKNGNYI